MAGSPRNPHPGSWNSSSAWIPGPWSSLGRSAVRLRGRGGRCGGATVRMLGTFLTEDPMAVPASVVRFVAQQLGLDDEHFAEYSPSTGRARRRCTNTRGRSAAPTATGTSRLGRRSCGSFWRRGCGRRWRGRGPCSTGRWCGW
ncbi:DUF4158 domain-containing protein [Streptomyces murinus]|uniref:DUF4158 domain-containing protein n=1 Tax=Streptomyces murinus TaxID=33900 RepID=UPI003B75D1A5